MTVYGLDQLDELADEALAVCERVRFDDAAKTFTDLASECLTDPGRITQLMMALAAWVDYEAGGAPLGQRVERINQDREARRTAGWFS